MRWYWGIRCLLFFGAVLGLRFVTTQAVEPVYGGKPVSQWLEGGYEQASLALQEIGPPAAPYVLAKLSREDPRHGSSRKYQRLWCKIPLAFRNILPKLSAGNFDELRACEKYAAN